MPCFAVTVPAGIGLPFTVTVHLFESEPYTSPEIFAVPLRAADCVEVLHKFGQDLLIEEVDRIHNLANAKGIPVDVDRLRVFLRAVLSDPQVRILQEELRIINAAPAASYKPQLVITAIAPPPPPEIVPASDVPLPDAHAAGILPSDILPEGPQG